MEKQLEQLLDLGLKIHPLQQKNCWEIYASTPAKAVERFQKILTKYPKTQVIKINSPMDISFGVNLYGE